MKIPLGSTLPGFDGEYPYYVGIRDIAMNAKCRTALAKIFPSIEFIDEDRHYFKFNEKADEAYFQLYDV